MNSPIIKCSSAHISPCLPRGWEDFLQIRNATAWDLPLTDDGPAASSRTAHNFVGQTRSYPPERCWFLSRADLELCSNFDNRSLIGTNAIAGMTSVLHSRV